MHTAVESHSHGGSRATSSADARPLDLGAQYGGFFTACQQEHGQQHQHKQLKECVLTKCEALFADPLGGGGRSESLLAGCRWFVEWFEAADNPVIEFAPAECPDHFTRTGGPGFARPLDQYQVAAAPPLPPQSPLVTYTTTSSRVLTTEFGLIAVLMAAIYLCCCRGGGMRRRSVDVPCTNPVAGSAAAIARAKRNPGRRSTTVQELEEVQPLSEQGEAAERWVMHTSPTGRPYWHNGTRSTWTKPPSFRGIE